MEMIDRYVHAVTQRLPEQQREDIRKELYGLIEDMLEEESPLSDPAPEAVEKVLLQLGHPSAMAAKYRGHDRYLISPVMFESYLSTLKIVLLAILLAMTVVFVIESIVEPSAILDYFTGYLVSLFSTGSQGFLWVTVAFALIDYGIRKKYAGSGELTKKWSPADLPPIPDPKSQIKLAEPVAGIIFTILFTIIFMFGSDLIGVYAHRNDTWHLITLMNPDVIGKYLPFIAILGILAVLKETYKIITRRRTGTLLAIHIGFSLVSLVFAGILLNTSGFWNPDFLSQLQAIGFAPQAGEDYEVIKTVWLTVTNNLFFFIALITVIDIISEIYKFYRVKLPVGEVISK
ncbi:hypothetical protein DFP94_11573 [Fontibacillus phaseoli]|uniref:Uncharacterized protein n=1 Tax=Fontibacillus phaseoli TaxID=1416533 RepID=A0A369B1G3_9BACL|nr:hypothetical protein [Fontibacillus phaseoli]RCX15389.1 hypothetical protein DFP94_11573 [Fontibacillus phaseoli]